MKNKRTSLQQFISNVRKFKRTAVRGYLPGIYIMPEDETGPILPMRELVISYILEADYYVYERNNRVYIKCIESGLSWDTGLDTSMGPMGEHEQLDYVAALPDNQNFVITMESMQVSSDYHNFGKPLGYETEKYLFSLVTGALLRI